MILLQLSSYQVIEGRLRWSQMVLDHLSSYQVIEGRLRSILGLFSSFRAICRMDVMVIIGHRTTSMPIIHLHIQKIHSFNMVVFLYTPTQYSFNRYICQIFFPFFDTPTQEICVYQTSLFCFDVSLCLANIFVKQKQKQKKKLFVKFILL